MNIKSLLLGSAAALVAVTGARAADAVVMVEPEPVEYVRVCDVYGAGFFYIPGTETCLSIRGYVRFDIAYSGEAEFDGVDLIRNDEAGLDVDDDGDDDNDYEFGTAVRARINIDAREETELGTLRAFVRIQADNSGSGRSSVSQTPGSDASYGMDQAYIQLGGLLMGYTESLWVSNVGGATGFGLLTDNGLSYGYQQRNQISYTFAANGFNASVSLEDDDTGDWAPDAVAKLAYAGSFGAVYGLVSYDENSLTGERTGTSYNVIFPGFGDEDRFEDNDGDEGAFAVKAGVILNDLFVADSGFKVEGTYSFDPSDYSAKTGIGRIGTVTRLVDPGQIPLEWTIGAAYSQGFGAFAATLAAQYGESFETRFVTTGIGPGGVIVPVGFQAEADYFAIQGDLQYNFTPNFFTLFEATYRNIDFDMAEDDDFDFDDLDFDDDDELDVDQFTAFLRFQRNF